MAWSSKAFTPDLLAKFLRSRKRSVLAQIAADYVEDHPDANCVQKTLVYFHDAFCTSFTERMKYGAWSFLRTHHQSILWNHWAGLGLPALETIVAEIENARNQKPTYKKWGE